MTEERLSFHAYLKHVAPALSQYDFFPTQTIGGQDAAYWIYRSASHVYRESSEGRDTLLGSCDIDAVQRVAGLLCWHYERLTAYQRKGVIRVRALVDYHACSFCQARNHEVFTLTALMHKFGFGGFPWPHQLPSDDEVIYCLGANYLSDVYEPKSSGDPEFDAFVDEMVSKVK